MVTALIGFHHRFNHPKLPAISTLIFIHIKIALIYSNDYEFLLNLQDYMCPSKRKPTLQVKSYYWDN